MAPPKVFISYSHDADDHKAWVLKLATDLRNNGVDATLDQWDLSPGQDIASFMQAGIVESDRVLMVCTESYVGRAESGSGGVGYERLIVTAELVQNIATNKFVPLIRRNDAHRVPNFLGQRLYVDFSDDAKYDEKLGELLRELHGQPASTKPPLGQSPFSGLPQPPQAATRAGPTGVTGDGTRLLDDAWFQANASDAFAGLERVGLKGGMELRFALHDPLGKSQVELLDAVRTANIRTFGWPIGVLLENREEYRPRPVNEGIRTEVAIAERSLSGESTYDYWAARVNGDFYLLQSLFEDTRRENQIFFNTRIVRVAEALMFCARFYRSLGAVDETRVSVRVSHHGLAGRLLSSSTPARHVSYARTAAEHASQSEFTAHLGDLEENLPDHVQRVLAPMFMLFDFMEFAPDIYTDIVDRFTRGDVS